jgi:hypothetical protein
MKKTYVVTFGNVPLKFKTPEEFTTYLEYILTDCIRVKKVSEVKISKVQEKTPRIRKPRKRKKRNG